MTALNVEVVPAPEYEGDKVIWSCGCCGFDYHLIVQSWAKCPWQTFYMRDVMDRHAKQGCSAFQELPPGVRTHGPAA